MLSSDEEHDTNLHALLQCAEFVLKAITSPDAVAMMPHPIKFVSRCLGERKKDVEIEKGRVQNEKYSGE